MNDAAKNLLISNPNIDKVYQCGDKAFIRIDDALAYRTTENFDITEVSASDLEYETGAQTNHKKKTNQKT